jgi:acetyl-CoA carboxylase biotin carboxyl carrier protein
MSEVKVRTTIGGSIWQIVAAAGDDVAKDDTILVMESMKMEIPIAAPRAGRVKAFLVQAGQVVAEDDVVALIETD